MRVRDKNQLLAELAQRSAAKLEIPSERVLAALADRERLGSTGLGRGFALPHARVDGLRTLFGLFARLVKPVNFEAIDGSPVDLVCLLLIPASAAGEHVSALATIAREMRDERRLAELRKARSAEALYAVLTGVCAKSDAAG